MHMTSFEALHGIKPSTLSSRAILQFKVAVVVDILQERCLIDQKLQENLAKARARMKFLP